MYKNIKKYYIKLKMKTNLNSPNCEHTHNILVFKI